MFAVSKEQDSICITAQNQNFFSYIRESVNPLTSIDISDNSEASFEIRSEKNGNSDKFSRVECTPIMNDTVMKVVLATDRTYSKILI